MTETKKKRYTLVGEVKEQVIALQKTPAAGIPSSFKSFGNRITYKKKFFCIVYAMPTSGKSEFVLQECLYLSREHNWKHILFTPEQGDPEDIIALLVHKMLGKPVTQIDGLEQADPSDILEAMKWLNSHFIIVSTDEGVTLEDIYNIVDEVKQDHPKFILDNIVIDNHNDLVSNLGQHGRQDLSIEEEMSYIRRQNKKRNIYSFLVTHTSDLGKPLTQDNIMYYPIPSPVSTRGGGSMYRKAYMMLAAWRVPFGLKDEMGHPYHRNQTRIVVQKAKPTHTGEKGFQGDLYWNWRTSTFTDQPPTIQLF